MNTKETIIALGFVGTLLLSAVAIAWFSNAQAQDMQLRTYYFMLSAETIAEAVENYERGGSKYFEVEAISEEASVNSPGFMKQFKEMQKKLRDQDRSIRNLGLQGSSRPVQKRVDPYAGMTKDEIIAERYRKRAEEIAEMDRLQRGNPQPVQSGPSRNVEQEARQRRLKEYRDRLKNSGTKSPGDGAGGNRMP